MFLASLSILTPNFTFADAVNATRRHMQHEPGRRSLGYRPQPSPQVAD
jgi:hypothetical protein